MEGKRTSAARHLRRSLLGAGSAAAMALVLALAAALELIGIVSAALGWAALAALAGISYAVLRSGPSERLADADFVAAQLVAAFLLLAWLTYRTDGTPAVMGVLYLLAMLYGVMELDRSRLAVAALIGLAGHGTALFMLIDDGRRLDLAAAWTLFGALAVAFAWLTYAAGTMLRLRERLAAAHLELHELAEEAKDRASRDALTGAHNRSFLVDALDREIARAERTGRPLSVARVDLDYLGSVNQAHGEVAGDVALKRFAAAAAGALRDVDVFGRYAGKQFLAVMPDTALQGAVIAAERIRATVAREPVPEVQGRRSLSCTAGVAEHRKGENARLVLARAEAGLTYGKAAGRDRVVALGAEGGPLAAGTG
jgi:diguanylate cyclase (GGDEF)-like protein